MQTDYEKQARLKLITTIVALVIVAGIILVADHLRSKTSVTAASPAASSSQQATTTTSTNTATATPTTVPTPAATSSAYTDGTYSAASQYYVPHSAETIKVTLTLKNGVVTNSTIQNSEGDRDSQQYQEDFASVYKSYVVGKSIKSLRLGTIAGASDTTQGFNDAVSQIASKAQA